MKTKTLPVGTLVIAIKNIGLAQEGVPGIITEVVEVSFFFWKRPMYLCTFLGNLKLAMKPSEINDFNHGYSKEQLEEPIDNRLSPAKQLQRIRPLNNS